MSDTIAGVYSDNKKTLEADVPPNGALVIVYNPTTKAAFIQAISGETNEAEHDIALLNGTLREMKTRGIAMDNIHATVIGKDDFIRDYLTDDMKKHDLSISSTSQDGSIQLYLNTGNFVRQTQEQQQENSIAH